MVKAATKIEEVEVRKPEELMIDSWNSVVDALINLKEKFEEHKRFYHPNRGVIKLLHPLDQRVLHRRIHRQRFEYFLEDITRDARLALEQLRIGGK